MTKKQSVFDDPNPGRVNIWVKRHIKAIIKAKMDKDPHFNFSEYVESLIIEKEKHGLNNAAVSGLLHKADGFKYMCSECGKGYDCVDCGCPRCNDR